MEILCLILSLLSIGFGVSQAKDNADLDDRLKEMRVKLQQVQVDKLNQSVRQNAEIRALEDALNNQAVGVVSLTHEDEFLDPPDYEGGDAVEM